MNKDTIVDALSGLDEDMVQEVAYLRQTSKKPMWIRWAAMAACFVLVAGIGYYASEYFPDPVPNITEPTAQTDETQPIEISGTDLAAGVYVNHMLYVSCSELSETAAEKNVGTFVGYVSKDNICETDICAYSYLPNDGKTNKIIVPYNGTYTVYSFEMYVPDGTDAWPMNLLDNAAYVQICVDYGEAAYLTYSEPDDVAEILGLLSELGPKHHHSEQGQYYYDLFKDRFHEGKIWINEYGYISTADQVTMNILQQMIWGTDRRIEVVMKDHTKMSFLYYSGAGTLQYSEVVYFLSEDQVHQINHLIGVE